MSILLYSLPQLVESSMDQAFDASIVKLLAVCVTAELLSIKVANVGMFFLPGFDALTPCLAVSQEPRCGWFVFRVKVSHRLLKHHKGVCFL